MAHSIGRLLGVAAAITGLLLVPFAGAAAAPIRMDDPPSWDDVNAAKANEAAKNAEVTKIQGILAQNTADASAKHAEALKLGNEYQIAVYNAQVAQTTASDLQQRTITADAAAEKAKLQVGAIVAQLYKAGGDTTVNLLLKENDADSLLYRLGAMSQLSDQTAGLKDAAVAAANTAESLKKQADVAAAARDQLEQDAATKKDDAEAAEAEANALVHQNEQQKTTLIAQLASLKNTTTEVEAAYQKHQDELAAEAARQAQAKLDAAAAAQNNATDYGGSGDGSSWVPGSDSVATTGQAQDIAASMIGAYGWGGDQFGCLVDLWQHESGWRVNAYNPSSGAYGIAQSWPADKMSSVADDWPTNAATQITWGLNYIQSAYGSPCRAWALWNSRSPNWY